MRSTESEVQAKYKETKLDDEVTISTYTDMFKAFGVNPKKNMPSNLALATRVAKGKNLPDINPMVNLYNACSLKFLLPFGGEDLGEVYGDSELAIAEGGEHWLGIGEEEAKGAQKGEIIWHDDFDVTCLSWNWRQCDRTKVTEDTEDGYFIIDCVGGLTDEAGKLAAEYFAQKVAEFFEAKVEINKLNKNNPECEIDFESKPIDGVEKPKSVGVVVLKKSVSEKKCAGVSYDYAEGTLENKIQHALFEALYVQQIDIPKCEIPVEKSSDRAKGDLTSTVVLKVARNFSKNPIELSKIIATSISPIEGVGKVEAIAPGFINFFLDSKSISDVLKTVEEQGDTYGRSTKLANEKWLIEHTSPNPNKSMHLGHLRNNVTGMAVSNLISAAGAEVIRDCIDNNRGIALAKLMWGYLCFANKNKFENLTIDDWYEHRDQWNMPEDVEKLPDRYMDEMYVLGSKDFEENKDVEKQVRDLVVRWENHDPVVWALWEHVLGFSYQGQQRTLKRLGSKWDKVWHEHEHYQKGKDLVSLGLEKGIFKIDDGAVITQLEKYKIPNTIVTKSDGTSLYITQDLALTQLKKETFHPDKIVWVVGPEQALALKQMYAVCEQLGIGKVNEFIHLPYGYMSIKGQGKMSSREGNVLYIDDLLDTARDKVLAYIKEKGDSNLTADEKLDIAEKVGSAAIKYSILKVGRLTDLAFDFDVSLSFEGDSAPYIMYSYVRTKSILRQASLVEEDVKKLDADDYNQSPIEEQLLKFLADFPKVVEKAALQFAPNYVCSYLYDLARQFSDFYNQMPILKAESEQARAFRLKLALAVGQVIKNGLGLLGIEVVEKM